MSAWNLWTLMENLRGDTMKRNLSNKKWTGEIVDSTSRSLTKFMKRYSNKKLRKNKNLYHPLTWRKEYDD